MSTRAIISKIAFAAFSVVIVASPATAQSAFGEAALLETMASRSDSGVPLRDLKRQGYLTQRPLTRQDYDDYYIPRKSLFVLGSRVLMVSENYFLANIGCCVDQGIGLYFVNPPPASLASIRAFSSRGACSIKEGVDKIYVATSLEGFFRPNRQYVYLKCGGTR